MITRQDTREDRIAIKEVKSNIYLHVIVNNLDITKAKSIYTYTNQGMEIYTYPFTI